MHEVVDLVLELALVLVAMLVASVPVTLLHEAAHARAMKKVRPKMRIAIRQGGFSRELKSTFIKRRILRVDKSVAVYGIDPLSVTPSIASSHPETVSG